MGMLWASCLGLWGQGQKAVAQSIENIRIESDYRKVRLTYDLLQGSGNGSPLDVSVVFRSESGRTIVPTKVSGDYLQVLPGRDKKIEWDAYAELGDFSGELYAELAIEDKLIIDLNGRKIEVAEQDFPEQMTWMDAIRACEKLGKGWRLPSKEELKVVYEQLYKKGKGNFKTDNWYWSSSENNANSAWYFYFEDGEAYYTGDYDVDKNYTRHVRAVRALP